MTPWPPPPRGVKWSNWHRIQDLFIRPIRSASSSVPAGQPGRAVLWVCHVYNVYICVMCVWVYIARATRIYILRNLLLWTFAVVDVVGFFPVVFLLVLSILQSSANTVVPLREKQRTTVNFSFLLLVCPSPSGRPHLWFQS